MSRGPGSDDDDPWGQTVPDAPPGGDQATVRSPAAGAPREAVKPGPPKKDFPELLTIDADFYAVTGELAHGGMGRILAARDRRLGRQVAIKELLSGHRNAAVRARFERETRITARLQHPGIISVIEAGLWPNGEPFFAMKYVEGESLDKAVGRCKSVGERMALITHVIAAVDALAYAHDRGVIHRDLKPQNVLVGKYGETVVIDWGLAKELEDGEAKQESIPHRPRQLSADGTLDGEVMGTPAFMPREQALGDPVDTRADVYALGAILYYVLTGAPPFTGKNVAQVLNAVIAERPRPLTELVSGIPEDLSTIVSKAMALAPGERYADAGALATDLKHFQTGQLVGSHRYSRWQRVRRFIRRHRAAAAITVASLVLFAVMGTVAVRRILAERERTEAERRAAVEARTDAEQVLDFMLFDLRDKLVPVGKLDLLGTVAQQAIDYYARRPQLSSAEDIRRRAEALTNLGRVIFTLGDLPKALEQYKIALELLERLRSNGQMAPSDWSHLANTYQLVGTALRDQGDEQGAYDQYHRALAIQLAHSNASAEAQRNLARAHRFLGSQRLRLGDPRGAMEDLERSRALLQLGFMREPLFREWPEELMYTHNEIADVLVELGDLKGALRERRMALALAEGLLAAHPEDSTLVRALAVSHSQVSRALEALGDSEGAIAELRADLELGEKLCARDPSNALYLSDLAQSHGRMGTLLHSRGDLAGAERELRACLAIYERRTVEDPSDVRMQRAVMTTASNLASVLIDRGQLVEARALLERARDLAARLMERDPSSGARLDDLSLMESQLAVLLQQLHDMPAADVHFQASIDVAARRVALDSASASGQRSLLVAHGNYGEFLHEKGDSLGAIRELGLTLEIAERLAALSPDDAQAKADVVECHKAIADARLAHGEPKLALEEYRKALAVAETLAAQDPSSAEYKETVDGLRERVATCCRQ